MAFAIPARRAKPAPAPAMTAAPIQAPAVSSPATSPIQAVAPKAVTPMQQAAMGRTVQSATTAQPGIKAGVVPSGLQSPASNKLGLLPGMPQAGAPQSPAPGTPQASTPAPGSSGAVEASGDAEMDQLLNDMYALNDKTGADIKQAGQDRFGAMQRAAMAASGRFGGGVGGAVLSTQGDMLQQANRGMADALLANSGQRQQIMGNALSMKHGDYRDDLNYARDVEGRTAEMEADLNSQDLATSIKGAQNMAASAMKQQGTGDPLAGVVNDQEMQGLFDAIGAAKTADEARAALDALNAALAKKNAEYQAAQGNSPTAQAASTGAGAVTEQAGVNAAEIARLQAKLRSGARLTDEELRLLAEAEDR